MYIIELVYCLSLVQIRLVTRTASYTQPGLWSWSFERRHGGSPEFSEPSVDGWFSGPTIFGNRQILSQHGFNVHIYIYIYIYIHCNWANQYGQILGLADLYIYIYVHIYIYTHIHNLVGSNHPIPIKSCALSRFNPRWKMGKKWVWINTVVNPRFSIAAKWIFIPLTHVEIHRFWPVPMFFKAEGPSRSQRNIHHKVEDVSETMGNLQPGLIYEGAMRFLSLLSSENQFGTSFPRYNWYLIDPHILQ